MHQHARGMTLLEVLVAFVVLAMSLGVIFHIFSGGLRNANSAESYSRAMFLAESKMSAVGAEHALVPGVVFGVAEPHLRWKISVTATDETRSSKVRVSTALRLYEVRVQVDWGDGDKIRLVELTTLRSGPGT